MKALRRLSEEAVMHREKYELHKDSPDDWLRRKVHHDLDRWLMQHREAVIILVTEALERELAQATKAAKSQDTKKPKHSAAWWRRLTTR